MRTRLGDADRRAVDLLLDRPAATANTDGEALPAVNQVFAMSGRNNFEERLDAVDQVLAVLEHLPAEEPPQNLVKMTLSRIEEAALEPRAFEEGARPAPFLRDTTPHA